MTSKELEKALNEIDWNSLSDEELNKYYLLVRSKTVELNRIINFRKHLKIRRPSTDKKTN